MVNEEMLDGWLPPEDNSEGLGSIPEGTYPSQIVDIEARNTQSGGFMWRVSLEVADGGQFHGRKLWYNMNWLDGSGNISGGIGFTQMALKAMGINHVSQTPGQNQPIQLRKSDVVGKIVNAIVSIQQGGEYAGRNQVDRLEAYGDPAAAPGMAPPAPAAAPPAAAVPQAPQAAPAAQPVAPTAPAPPGAPPQQSVVAASPTVAPPPAAVPPAQPPAMDF